MPWRLCRCSRCWIRCVSWMVRSIRSLLSVTMKNRSGFSRTTGTHNGYDFPFVDFQIDAFQDLKIFKTFVYLFNFYHELFFFPMPTSVTWKSSCPMFLFVSFSTALWTFGCFVNLDFSVQVYFRSANRCSIFGKPLFDRRQCLILSDKDNKCYYSGDIIFPIIFRRATPSSHQGRTKAAPCLHQPCITFA